MRLSAMPVRPTRSISLLSSTLWSSYRQRRCSSCWAAATAKPIACRMMPGAFSGRHRWDGAACRRSATSYTRTSRSDMSIPGPRERPTRHTRLRKASAGTSPIGHSVLPLLEHSRALLHRLRERHWLAAALRADGFRCMDGSVPRRSMAYLRPAQQCAPHRAHPHRNGRDAADVPLTHIFGPGELRGFKVWTDEAAAPSS